MRPGLESFKRSIFVLLFVASVSFFCRAAETNEFGLILTLKSVNSPASADLATAPNISLFVEAGQPCSPFVAGGKFTATWEGSVSAELRSDFSFQAELNGQLQLEINGKTVYEAANAGAAAPLSKPIQLNKGTNALRAVYTSPNKGDAFVRLWWTEKPPYTTPIPFAVLTHSTTAELKSSLQRHLGRELFLEHRCINCHKGANQAIPELSLDAPSFEGIGGRRKHEWMARWILDPKAARASVHMPKLLNGPTAKVDAEAIAAYLGSLKTGGEVSIPEPKIKSNPSNLADNDATPDQNEEHKSLFDKLHCIGCHNAPDENLPTKISLKHVAHKFGPGKLAEFLRAPEAHFAWTRMPNFHLTSKEAGELSEFLLSKADEPATDARGEFPLPNGERGRTLLQTVGCLNCHKAPVENKFTAPTLSALTPDKWTQGCVAAESKADSKAPQFGFSSEQREALKAFGATDRQSLARHVPAEFAERQTRLLNCNGCHGQVEGFPPLEVLGGKLKPEWAAKFIAGEISYKPRTEKHPRGDPWLEIRMPSFKSRATLLANGLAAQHGYSPHAPAEPPIDMDLAKIGQKLIGKDGGFSCISCHGVGNMEALEVFESEGINFAYSSERLLPEYYRRWVRNPLAIDAQTKMPVYFEEGKSPLTEVLDGDAEKQITAIWQYLRLGPKMPPPSNGAGQ